MNNFDDIQTEHDDCAEKEKKSSSSFFHRDDFFDIIEMLLQSIAVVAVIFMLLFRFVSVNGSSMNPTLMDKDWLAVSTLSKNYERGDVVIAAQPNERNEVIVKRVIAFEGEVVDITPQGYVTVNGVVLEEEYVSALIKERGDIKFPHKVPEGKVFLMGDNRNESLDSRYGEIGDVSVDYIIGKAKVKLFPFGDFIIDKPEYSIDKGEKNE